MRQEADVPIAERCKVGFKIQSPIISRQGVGPAPRNSRFGGWAEVSNLKLVKILLSILTDMGHLQATEK
jgi:hypothetical protein